MKAQCSSEALWDYLTTRSMIGRIDTKSGGDLVIDVHGSLAWSSYWAVVRQTGGAAAVDCHGTGSKERAYFTLEKSAAILASFPS
jgi:hypothetical protein